MGMEILKNLQLIGELYKTKDDTTIIEELKQYSTPNYLANKVLCVTGDSEAAGHIVTDTYSKLIAQRNNMTLSNTAVNARKMAYVEDNPGAGTPLAKNMMKYVKMQIIYCVILGIMMNLMNQKMMIVKILLSIKGLSILLLRGGKVFVRMQE